MSESLYATSADRSCYPAPRVVFLIGMPRSGTKLLRQLLNQHSKIRIPEVETEFFPLLTKYVETHGECSDYSAFLEMFESMKVLPFFTYMSEESRSIDPLPWYNSCTSYDAAGLFVGLLRCSTDVHEKDEILIGDKSPSYINQLPLLQASFPEASFVHIVRDPRDYCLSIKRAWGKSMVRAASRWSASIECLLHMKGQPGFYELRYEDLVSDPGGELASLCAFLDLPFESTMTVPAKPVENLGDARGTLEVMAGNTEKHTRLMPAKTRLRIEQIACREMRAYGYQLEWEGEPLPAGPILEVWLQFLDGINLVRYESRKRGIFGSVVFYWNYFRATRAI